MEGRCDNNRLVGEGSVRLGRFSCSSDLHGEQRWRSRHESPKRRKGHCGGREPESKCSRSSDAAHSITGTAHPTLRGFITEETHPLST